MAAAVIRQRLLQVWKPTRVRQRRRIHDKGAPRGAPFWLSHAFQTSLEEDAAFKGQVAYAGTGTDVAAGKRCVEVVVVEA